LSAAGDLRGRGSQPPWAWPPSKVVMAAQRPDFRRQGQTPRGL